MSKIELPPLRGTYPTTQALNDRLSAIETQFNDYVLYRDNPPNEPNEMFNVLDMSENAIINLPYPIHDSEAVSKGYLERYYVEDFDNVNSELDLINAQLAANAADIETNATSITMVEGGLIVEAGRITTNSAAIDGIIQVNEDQATDIAANAYNTTQLVNTVTVQGNTIDAHSTSIELLETSIDTLTTDVEGNTTDVSLNSQAITSLETQSTVQDGLISTNAQAIEGISSSLDTTNSNVDGVISDVSANTDAIDTLTTSVNQQGSDIAVNATNISSVTASLALTNNNVASVVSDTAVNTTAVDTLNTTVSQQGSAISANTSSIDSISSDLATTNTNVDGTVADIAVNTSAIDSLTSTVTQQGDSITANTTSIDQVSSSLDDLTTTVDGVATDVSTNANAISSLTTDVTSNASGIAANSAALTTINSTLTDNETGIEANAQAISSLDTRVTATETGTSANAQAITGVQSSVSSVSAVADQATTAAGSAQDSADQANSAASTAQSAADQAATDAGAAQATADSASSDASAAQTTADGAASAASTAQGTADQATTAASAAQGTADQAVTDAGAAQTTANQAVLAASNAQDTASHADSNAATALDEINTINNESLPGIQDAIEGNASALVTLGTQVDTLGDTNQAYGSLVVQANDVVSGIWLDADDSGSGSVSSLRFGADNVSFGVVDNGIYDTKIFYSLEEEAYLFDGKVISDAFRRPTGHNYTDGTPISAKQDYAYSFAFEPPENGAYVKAWLYAVSSETNAFSTDDRLVTSSLAGSNLYWEVSYIFNHSTQQDPFEAELWKVDTSGTETYVGDIPIRTPEYPQYNFPYPYYKVTTTLSADGDVFPLETTVFTVAFDGSDNISSYIRGFTIKNILSPNGVYTSDNRYYVKFTYKAALDAVSQGSVTRCGTVTSMNYIEETDSPVTFPSLNDGTEVWQPITPEEAQGVQESDPVFQASAASGISSGDIDNWNTAVSGLSWKDPVATTSALTTTYPDAEEGWAAFVTAEDHFYIYNGSSWVLGAGLATHNTLGGLNAGTTYLHVTSTEKSRIANAIQVTDSIDANTLNNQAGSYYRNAGNMNAGTLPVARLPATISSNTSGNAATATTASAVPWSGVSDKPTIPSAANNASITLSAGTNVSGGGVFTTDQSTDETITFNVASSSTSTKGVVQLNDATDSDSTTTAATSNAVKLTAERAEAGVTAAAIAVAAAGVAQTDVETAQTTADGAQTAADAAQASANAAQSSADSAQSTASSALTTANAALPATGTAADSDLLEGNPASSYMKKGTFNNGNMKIATFALGVYRYESTTAYTNVPSGALSYGNMAVFRGTGDTWFKLLGNNSNTRLWLSGGNDAGSVSTAWGEIVNEGYAKDWAIDIAGNAATATTATTATTASGVPWSGVTNKPTIPSAANNATITLGGIADSNATFTTNQSSAETITIHNESDQASVYNSLGVVVQDIGLDAYGHISSVASYDLDNRYYTESEINTKFTTTNSNVTTAQNAADGAQDAAEGAQSTANTALSTANAAQSAIDDIVDSALTSSGGNMVGSLLWSGDQDYDGLYWGQQFKDSSAHSGAWAYIRQGSTQGQIQIGSDNLIEFMETDSQEVSVSISTNDDSVTAGSFIGSGASLTSLNADNLTTGTVPNARLYSASSATKGIVQLSSSVTSTSTTLAATSSAAKSAYDRGSLGIANAATAQSAAVAAQSTANAALPASTYTASDILTKLKTVDSNDSGLNADTLDGIEGSGFLYNNATWTGGTGSSKTTLFGGVNNSGDGKLVFYSDDGVTDVSIDGQFYANEGASLVWDAGNSPKSSVTNSSSTSQIATSKAAKAAYDRGSLGITNAATAQSTANAALPKSGGTLTGAIKVTNAGAPQITLGDGSQTNDEVAIAFNTASDQSQIGYLYASHLDNKYGSGSYAWKFSTGESNGQLFVEDSAGTHKVWHSGNDGASSGLSAQYLNGQLGSYYTNATNISSGTISDARLPATISSNITGNSATATALATARTFDITGDVTGTAVSFNGTNNVSFSASVVDDSHNHTTLTGIEQLTFGPGTSQTDTAYMEWLGGSNAGYLRISTADDNGTEYIQFGDYDTADTTSTFTQWLKLYRGQAQFTGTVSATTFSGALSGNASTATNANNADTIGGRSTSTSDTANTVALRNGSGDIYARLFRSTYQDQSTISGAIAYRVSTTDNYIRYCSDMSAVRTFVDVPSKAGSGASGTWGISVTGNAATATTATTAATASDSDTVGGRSKNQLAWLSTSGSYDQVLPTQGSWLRSPSSGFLPDADNSASLGSSSWRWSNVYTNKIASGSGSLSLQASGSLVIGNSSVTSSTDPTTNGNMHVYMDTFFIGPSKPTYNGDAIALMSDLTSAAGTPTAYGFSDVTNTNDANWTYMLTGNSNGTYYMARFVDFTDDINGLVDYDYDANTLAVTQSGTYVVEFTCYWKREYSSRSHFYLRIHASLGLDYTGYTIKVEQKFLEDNYANGQMTTRATLTLVANQRLQFWTMKTADSNFYGTTCTITKVG